MRRTLVDGIIILLVPSNFMPSAGTSHERSQRLRIRASNTDQQGSLSPQESIYGSINLAEAADNLLSNGELEEDVMDISHSDVDEGEIPYTSLDQGLANQDDRHLVDEEEGFEPPEGSVTDRRSNPDINTAHNQSDDQIADKDKLDMGSGIISGQTSTKITTEASKLNEELPFNANVQDDEQSLYPTSSLADDSDPDDYEPPEPAPVEEDSAVQPRSGDSSNASLSQPGQDIDHTNLESHSESASGLHGNMSTATTTAEACSEEVRPRYSSTFRLANLD